MNKILVILMPAILVIGILIGYIIKQSPVPPATPSISPTITAAIIPTVTTPIPTEIKGLLYKNTKYNFTLVFLDTWQNYKVTTYEAQDPNNRTICFSIPTSSPNELPICILQMYAYPKQEWAATIKKPIYITENSQYIFAYGYIPECVQHSPFQCSRAKEIPSIISTFTFTN